MHKVLILLVSLTAVATILWWFFGKRESSEILAHMEGNQQVVTIIVDGGYLPNVVILKLGIPAKLIFHRKDPSSCLEEVILPDFGKQARLPVGKPFEIVINPDKMGEFQYSCGMRMFFGKVVVK